MGKLNGNWVIMVDKSDNQEDGKRNINQNIPKYRKINKKFTPILEKYFF